MMRIKSLFTLLALVFLAAGLVLSLSGCSGGTSQPSSVSDPVIADTTEPIAEEPAEVAPEPEAIASTVEDPVVEEPAEVEPSTESVAEELSEQLILSWARDAGGLNHCDRLSIYAAGRVEAVVCRANTPEPIVHGNLTEEQLTQVLAWAAEYALFTRRESEMTNAVRATTLHGSGGAAPALEVKVEIAAFAADIFLGLTETE